MGVTSHITELRRIRNFTSDRKVPGTKLLTFSTEHEAILDPTKAFERIHDLKDKGMFLLPASFKEDSRKEKWFPKKRRQLLKQNVPRDKLKIRN